MRTARRLKTAPQRLQLPSKGQLQESVRKLRLDRHDAFKRLDEAVKNEPAYLLNAVVSSMLDIQKLSREIGIMEGLLMKPGSYQLVARRRSKP